MTEETAEAILRGLLFLSMSFFFYLMMRVNEDENEN